MVPPASHHRANWLGLNAQQNTHLHTNTLPQPSAITHTHTHYKHPAHHNYHSSTTTVLPSGKQERKYKLVGISEMWERRVWWRRRNWLKTVAVCGILPAPPLPPSSPPGGYHCHGVRLLLFIFAFGGECSSTAAPSGRDTRYVTLHPAVRSPKIRKECRKQVTFSGFLGLASVG